MGLSTSSLLNKFTQDPRPLEEDTGVDESPPELIPDVIWTIFALLEVPDRVRAASTCSLWRSVYTSQLAHHDQRQSPCLLYTSESSGDNVACLYSLAEKRVYELVLPDPPIRTRYIIGSSNGWIVTADDMSELHILNPVTGEQIALPSVLTLEQVTPVLDSEGILRQYAICVYNYPTFEIDDSYMCDFHELRDYLYFKAFVFPDPFTGSYIVVLVHEGHHCISFVRAGDCEWTFLPHGWHYHDCFYKDGLLYATKANGQIVTFDLTTQTVTVNMVLDDMKWYINEMIYIVQSPWSDTLLVWRKQHVRDIGNTGDIIKGTGNIYVYKVDMTTNKLVEIDDLNDHVLFIGRSQSHCLSVEEYPHLKANCAYFTGDYQYIGLDKDDQPDIGVLNLGDNSIQKDVVPQIYSSWPNPIWITPNLRMMSSGLM